MTVKEYVKPEQVMASIINLRDEVMKKCATSGVSANLLEIYYKLNSCLYSEYPHNVHSDENNKQFCIDMASRIGPNNQKTHKQFRDIVLNGISIPVETMFDDRAVDHLFGTSGFDVAYKFARDNQHLFAKNS